MNTNLSGAGATLAVAAVLGIGSAAGALAQDNRVLTVEQTAIQAVQAPPALAANPLGVVAWVDHRDNTYATGERVRLFVQTNKDAWVTVLNVGPDGSTTVLFPNQFQGDNLVRANAVTEVPDAAAQARITVAGASGAELIKVIASSRPMPLFEAAQLGRAGAFQSVRGRAGQTARTLPGGDGGAGGSRVGRLRQGHPHRAAPTCCSCGVCTGLGARRARPGGRCGVAGPAVRAAGGG